MTENAISEVFNFTQLQRFRQNRNLLAFDKAKPIVANQVVDSDSDDESNSDGEPGIENKNTQNRFPVSARSGSSRGQAPQQIKSQRKQAIGEEKLRELEGKWWLQGDIEAVKRSI